MGFLEWRVQIMGVHWVDSGPFYRCSDAFRANGDPRLDRCIPAINPYKHKAINLKP